MATVDSLDIQIEGSAQKANKAVDSLIENLGKLANALKIDTSKLSNIGKSVDLSGISKQAKTVSESVGNMGAKVAQSMKPVQEQAKEAAKSISEVTKEFQEKFKGISVEVDFSKPESELKKFQKQAENAQNALSRIMASSDADKQTKSIEKWSISLAQANNAIEQLQSHLSSMKNEQVNVAHVEIADLSDEQFKELLKTFPTVKAQAEEVNQALSEIGNEAAEAAREFTGAWDGIKLPDLSGKTDLSRMTPTEIDEWFKNLPTIKAQAEQVEKVVQKVSEAAVEASKEFTGAWNGVKIPSDLLSGANSGLKDFREQLKQLQIPKINEENLTKLQNELQKAKDKMASLKTEMANKLTMGKITESLDDKGYRNLREQIALTGKEINALQEKIKEVSEKTKESSAEMRAEFENNLKNLKVPPIHEDNIDKLQNNLKKAEEKLEELKTKLSNGLQMGSITENIDDSGYVRLREQIELSEKTIEALKEKIEEVETQSRRSGGLQKLGGLFSKLVAPVKLAASALKGTTSLLKKIGSFVGGAVSKLSKLAKSFKGLKGANGGANASFGSSLKTMLKYTLGIRSLYTLFNKLRSAIKEGMKNLVQYSGETNASISLLSNSMNQLKNASAAMAAPLLNAFAPAINQIIQLCIKAENSINQLVSSVMGKGTWIKAKALTDDYAKSVSKAGKAAKGSLRSFDELKTITTQEDDDGFETSPEDMFETVEVEDNFKNLAESLKGMWEDADFTDIGAMIGGKIKGALENIPWDSIKQTVSNAGKSFATLINGIVEVPGLALSIGKTIGEAINTGITAINSFLDNTHWDSVGKFIGEGLNGIVNAVDWEGLGHLFAAKWNAIFEVLGNLDTTFDWKDFGLKLATGVNTFISDFNWTENGAHLGELIKGILDTIITFLEETNWQELGEKVADFIGSIDWTGIFERLAEGIGAALGGLAAFLWGLIKDAWSSVVGWWNEVAYRDGKFTAEGLLDGIVQVWRNIVQWIGDHIVKPFINGFKKAFGIHSPSTVMAEQGGFLMQGLLNGISSLVQSVIDIFNKIKEKIVAVWDEIKTKTSEVWNGIKTFVANLWNGLKLSASIAFNNIKTTITNIWNSIKTVTVNVWNGIKNAVKTPINAIIGFINGMTSGISSGINGLINALNTLKIDVPSWVTTLTGIESFGFNISNISIPQIPMLAKGGIAVQYTPAIIGESGTEAVLPLTNKRTMNMIADSIFENASYNGGYAYSDGFGMGEKRTDELIAETRKQNQLLQEQNRLLESILNKPSISNGEIFSAAKSVYKGEATRRYGNSAAFDPVWG